MIDKQKGFILVTSLVLLSILTLLGSAAAFKTLIEAKVSRMSGEGMQAFVAANAGLQKQFYEWAMDTATPADGDRAELVAVLDDVVHTQSRYGSYTAAAVYAPRITPAGIDDFRTRFAGGDIDAYIQGATDIRVFELTSSGISLVANSAWRASGKEGVQQVAVWATSFEPTTTDEEYPYKTPNSVDCLDCTLTLYALGRYGSSYRLVRQKMTNNSLPKLEGVNAMLNAPPANDFNGVCGTGTTAGSANGEVWDPTEDGPAGLGNTIVEGTQAPYQIGTTPSGTILASNTNLATGNKGFRHGKKSQLGATFDNAPLLLYSGHNTKSAFKIDWANTKVDTAAVDLPANLIPTRLTNSPLLGTADQVNYFVDPNHQLFSMDSYRWAAEQFTCQDVNEDDGEFGNGIYCSKAEALRQAVQAQFPDAVVPVTGRLTVTQFQWNIAHAIPMFGFVRVMFPAEQGTVPATSATCNDKTYILHVIEGKPKKSPSTFDFTKLEAGGTYTGAVIGGRMKVSADDDGQLGTNARLMVYGSLLVDYFADYDICTVDKKLNLGVVCNTDTSGGTLDYNSTFDPAGGERLLTPLESPDVYLAVEHNIMINPAMPRFEGQDPLPIPTAASGGDLDVSGQVNMVDLNESSTRQANRVNLASPYDGYYPWSEGILPPRPEGPAGTMRLMARSTDTPSTGYISAAKAIGVKTEVSSLPTDLSNMLSRAKPARSGQSAGTEADVLHYYYKVMKSVTSTSNAQDYPIAPWPGNNLSGNFCIGVEDCGTSDPAATSWNNNMGDKVHLMFPKGYIHGWKVALAALDMKAKEWNHILSGQGGDLGISDPVGLYNQLRNDCSQTGAIVGPGCPAGQPFNFGYDAGGFNDAAVEKIEADEYKYYYITPDPTTEYGLMDYDWKDIPSTMYSGGLLDMHAHSNMNGIIYTPGPLEWEAGNSDYDGGVHMSYASGSFITGYGSYVKNSNSEDRYVLAFDRQAVDNIAIDMESVVVLRRYAWQELR